MNIDHIRHLFSAICPRPLPPLSFLLYFDHSDLATATSWVSDLDIRI